MGLWDEATYPSSLVAAFSFGSHDCLKMVQKGGIRWTCVLATAQYNPMHELEVTCARDGNVCLVRESVEEGYYNTEHLHQRRLWIGARRGAVIQRVGWSTVTDELQP